MKTFNSLLVILLFSVFTFAISSCGNKTKTDKASTEQAVDSAKQGKEYTSAYICPMHCKGSGSDKPGKCPVCEMDYKKNEKHSDHSGGDSHEGHNHDDHEGHNHD